MENNRKLGKEQENRAAAALEKRGYRILARNFRCKIGEIDLIAFHEGYLVFVEVKYRKSTKSGYAAEAVTKKKQQTICRVADYYIRTHCSRIPACRFDVVALDGESINIYQNAFEYIRKN